MNNPIDIFAVAPKYDGNFFAFKTIGDAIQGTFVSLYDAVDGYNKEQYVIVLMDNENNSIFHKVGIAKDSTVLIEQLQKVKLGQIIGFRYAEDRPSKKYPGKNSKIIKLHEHYTLVNPEWIQSQLAKGFLTQNDFDFPAIQKFEADKAKSAMAPAPYASAPSAPVFTVPEYRPVAPNTPTVLSSAPVSQTVSTTPSVTPEVIKTMINLAVSNGHIEDMMNEESSLKAISAVTGLSVSLENVSAIVNQLAIKKA